MTIPARLGGTFRPRRIISHMLARRVALGVVLALIRLVDNVLGTYHLVGEGPGD